MMDFQLPEFFETEDTPQTETEKLLARIENIESVLLDGNTWRGVNGGVAAFGTVASLLGVSTLSPLSLLLLSSGSVFAAISYASYVLWEAKELSIKPSFVPLTSGEREKVKNFLPSYEKAHYRLIRWYGKDAVEYLESQGTLEEVIRHAGKIKPIEGRDDHLELARNQIAAYYLKGMPKKEPRRITQVTSTPPVAIASLPFVPTPVEEEPDDLWGDTIDSTQSPIIESYETDDLDDEETNDWSIFNSLKKSNKSNAVPTENIAQQIASATKSHFCFVAEPQTGKSSLLISSIELIKGDIYFVDCKGDDLRFRNLKKVNSKSKYLKVNEENSLKTFFKLLDALVQTMIERQSNTDRSPITFVVDEINILINIIESYQIETGEKNLFNKFKGKFMRLLNQGLSSGIRVIFTTHTTKVVELFGTSSALHAVSLIGLGKLNKTNSINDCIDYKIRPRHRDKISDEVEKALEQNPESVMALLCYTSPPRIANIPLVDYSHLLTGVESKSKTQTKKIEFPLFDDDLEDESAPTPNEVIQPVACTPNDLLAQLEKMGDGAYKPSYISSLRKNWKVSDIETAANGLHLAGEVELRNWDKAQGRAIVYYSQEQNRYRNSKVVMGNFGMAAHLGV